MPEPISMSIVASIIIATVTTGGTVAAAAIHAGSDGKPRNQRRSQLDKGGKAGKADAPAVDPAAVGLGVIGVAAIAYLASNKD